VRHFGRDFARQFVFTHEPVAFTSGMPELGDGLVRKDGFARKDRGSVLDKVVSDY